MWTDLLSVKLKGKNTGNFINFSFDNRSIHSNIYANEVKLELLNVNFNTLWFMETTHSEKNDIVYILKPLINT